MLNVSYGEYIFIVHFQQIKGQLRQDAIAAYHKGAKKDQLNMIKRKEMIETRKEYYENLNTEKERQELQEKEKHRLAAEKAEIKRRGEEEKYVLSSCTVYNVHCVYI